VDTKGTRQKKKIRIICTRTGDKFNQWWEDNLKFMVDKYSNIEYDEFVCIRDNRFEDDYGTFNNLIMFDRYRDNDWINLQFDLDVIIKGDCNKFLKKELHVCDSRQWQSETYYTYINRISSDIVSWSGDYSYIYQNIVDNLDYNYVKYHQGIDPYIFEVYNPKRFESGYTSIQTLTDYRDYDIIFFNGHADTMLKNGWWRNYTMEYK
tara:strand:+ start:559 stop:1179 length:621 start_codon:yes stop_codon:yes gene_type:complete